MLRKAEISSGSSSCGIVNNISMPIDFGLAASMVSSARARIVRSTGDRWPVSFIIDNQDDALVFFDFGREHRGAQIIERPLRFLDQRGGPAEASDKQGEDHEQYGRAKTDRAKLVEQAAQRLQNSPGVRFHVAGAFFRVRGCGRFRHYFSAGCVILADGASLVARLVLLGKKVRLPSPISANPAQ